METPNSSPEAGLQPHDIIPISIEFNPTTKTKSLVRANNGAPELLVNMLSRPPRSGVGSLAALLLSLVLEVGDCRVWPGDATPVGSTRPAESSGTWILLRTPDNVVWFS